MARKAEETPFVLRIRSLGLESLTALRDALVHGKDASTVNRWSKSEMKVDSTVDVLLRVAELVAPEKRAALWAPIPGLSRERAPIVRLLIAFDMLGKQERARALELAMSQHDGAALQTD